jgi:O-antigen/teichoic acid export membrane protein
MTAVQMWSIRLKRFGWIATARGMQAAAGVATQSSLGFLGVGVVGLPLGTVVNSGLGLLLLLRQIERRHAALMRQVSAPEMWALFRKFRRFPSYSTLEVVCNLAGNQVPLLMVAATAPGPEAGYIALALTLLQAPIGLLGNAISQVYTSRLAESASLGQLDDLTLRVFSALLRSGAGVIICGGIASPAVFSLLFGAQWFRSGELALWMTPWILTQLLAVPISMVYSGTDNQRLSMIVQFVGAVARLSVIIATWKVAPNLIGEAFSLSGAIFYGLMLAGAFWCASLKATRVFGALARSIPLLAMWAVAGLLVQIALKI